MQLPNLLEHDTIHEASEQAGYWEHLIKCAGQNAQRFLCSLFAPNCFEMKIYPCQSLCHIVKAGILNFKI